MNLGQELILISIKNSQHLVISKVTLVFLDLGILKGVTISGGVVMVATVEVSLDFPSMCVAEKGVHRPNKWESPPIILLMGQQQL